MVRIRFIKWHWVNRLFNGIVSVTVSDLNLDDLDKYLETNIKGFKNLRKATKFPDGQSNPTYRLDADSGSYVLRRQPFGNLLKSAHAVDREYRVIDALQNSDVPVPVALHLCEDSEQIGSLFYVMSFEQGRVLWDPALPDFSVQERIALYDEMNRVLAALHDVDVQARGLIDFGKPGNYFGRQIDRWSRQYRSSETETIEEMDQLMAWLPENLPADDGRVSLIHGDYRIDNIIFSNNSCSALAVLDWELSTLGHPFADLAYQCMQWRLDNSAVIPGLGDIDRQNLGLPQEQRYIEDYCRRRNLTGIDHWEFYLAFSFFRIAAILQGVLKRAIDGNASSEKAFQYGSMTPILAHMGLNVIS